MPTQPSPVNSVGNPIWAACRHAVVTTDDHGSRATVALAPRRDATLVVASAGSGLGTGERKTQTV